MRETKSWVWVVLFLLLGVTALATLSRSSEVENPEVISSIEVSARPARQLDSDPGDQIEPPRCPETSRTLSPDRSESPVEGSATRDSSPSRPTKAPRDELSATRGFVGETLSRQLSVDWANVPEPTMEQIEVVREEHLKARRMIMAKMTPLRFKLVDELFDSGQYETYHNATSRDIPNYNVPGQLITKRVFYDAQLGVNVTRVVRIVRGMSLELDSLLVDMENLEVSTQAKLSFLLAGYLRTRQ